MRLTKQGYKADRGTDYDGQFPEAMEQVRKMQDEMDVICKYLAPKGSVCNKCGRIHVSPFKRPII